MGSIETTAALLEELRPKALAVAYRMLGSVSDAEDFVQEALFRLHVALEDDSAFASPQAFLATIVTRLCIDELPGAAISASGSPGGVTGGPRRTPPGAAGHPARTLPDGWSACHSRVLAPRRAPRVLRFRRAESRDD